MLQSLFPITKNWSWGTFFLYIIVSIIVTKCCKYGAVWRAKISTDNNTYSKAMINSKLYYAIAFFVLVVLGTVRTPEVGNDTIVYIGYFDQIANVNFDFSKLFSFQQQEPGFQVYLKLIKSISSSYTFLFFVNSVLLATAYIKYIQKFFNEKSDYIFLQIFIYYYVSNMSGMRSALATIFLLFSFIYLAEEKYFKASILTLLACGFHYTMIYNFYIIIVTWVFKSEYLRRKRWLWYFALILTTLLSMTSTYFLRSLFSTTKYSYYTSKLEDISYLGSIFMVIFAILAILSYKEFMYKDYSAEFKNTFISTFGFLITYPMLFVTGAYRIPNYYIMPRLTIWGEMRKLYQTKFSNKQLFYVAMQIIVWVYLLFRFTRTSVDGGFIYHTIF